MLITVLRLMKMEYWTTICKIQWCILFRALLKDISQVQGHSLKLWIYRLNNKIAKHNDSRPHAESFVRQAYREACAVLGLLPVENLGFRASVRAAVQTTAQSGLLPSSCKFSLKLSSLRMLWHTCGRLKWPLLKVGTVLVNLDGVTWRTSIHMQHLAE